MFCELFALFSANFPFLYQIAFVANEYLANIIISKLFNLKHPLTDVLKCFAISHIIHYDDSMCTSIITCSQCSKSFLACCIPYLELNILSVHFYCFDFEVYTDRIEEVVVE